MTTPPELEFCKSCNQATDTLYATKENRIKAGGWVCVDCWFKHRNKSRRQQRMKGNPSVSTNHATQIDLTTPA